MYIATSGSENRETVLALDETIDSLRTKIPSPNILIAYFTECHDVALIHQTLVKAFPDTQILGCSSCQGAMSDAEFYQQNALVLWAAEDDLGAYGTAITQYHQEDAFHAAQTCVEEAIAKSGRVGELPGLVLLHATPGNEERVIEGIQSVIGPSVPVVGGSAADNQISGDWSVFTQSGFGREAISLAVFYPSCPISLSFHSGYASTGVSAVATKVEGREIIELDGEPAAPLYEAWITGNQLSPKGDFFSSASLNPIGRIAGEINGMAYFKLSHPYEISDRNGIRLFSTVEQGERVFLMAGTEERLVKRAGRVIDSALELGAGQIRPVGGLAIYCAGCMLQVREKMPEVKGFMYNAMHQMPFASAFTFGEQGQFTGGENAHGNLMISAVLFHSE
ncbi:FIST signal transduction protein [Thaumasiovibrio subtropicus]|uniref:FIST signal transduction protein n=1 Tax=Thaumasiovibrio subtropicus TaxID=1891207 RepID=UPI000B35C2EE|nr:FIST N-terminal domain-containing protein [Thaumasiovibrio subtropicus]